MRISDIFFTKMCVGCGKPMNIFDNGNVCDICKPDFKSVSDRIFYVNGLEFLKAYYFYECKVRMGLRRFKFYNDGYSGRIFAEKLAEMIKKESLLPLDYVIVSVPGRVNNTNREYVQADYLAKHTAKLLEKKYFSGVVRKRSNVKSQTRCRTAAERRENIKGGFLFNKNYSETVKGKDIVIIDDISTTGATLSEMADVLHHAGAKKIYGMCVAKTPNPCDRKDKNIIVNPENRKKIEIQKKQA